MNNDDTVAILNDLIEISKDGEEGFRISAELVNDENLKKTFLERAEGCERAEEVAKDVYTKALEQELPEEVRRIMQHQYEGLLKNYELVRNLRNTYDATRKN